MPAVVATVALAMLCACGGSDDATVTGTEQMSPLSTVVAEVTPVGFDMIAARVVAADGTTCDVCLWRADDGDERGRGLMGVTDLGAGDGMAFVYTAPTTTAFTMQNTLIPLSIAFFGADGVFLDAFDMEPCRAEPCPTHPTPADVSVAIEVEQGGLDELLIGTGSRLEPSDGDCPVAD